MKNKHLLLAAVLLPALLSGCGLEIFQDWQNSQGEAMPGAGAIAGKDYITGLEPSTNARDYFSTVSDDKPIETVSRNDSRESKTGVRFVNDGGIVIPPGVTISFENKGYCLDPNLPAPKAGDEYQFVPMKRLIPTELQGTYKRLIAQESAGSSDVKMNMQRLVWAMRTAGTESALANSLTSQQKQILDRCSDYAGQFESFNESAKSSNKLRKELNKLADSLITIRLGDVTYSASDLLNPESGKQKISDHVNHLIELGDSLPVENTGFNYGELEPGIYTDIQGTGYMQFHVRIANNTSKDYTFYPSDYVGQVGSPSKSSGLNLYAAECIGKQRMTCSNQDKTDVVDKKEANKNNPRNEEFLNIINSLMQDFPEIDGYCLGFDGEIVIDPALKVWGQYDPTTNVLTLKNENMLLSPDKGDLVTLYHEMSHYLQNNLDSDVYKSLSSLHKDNYDDRALGEAFASLMSLKLAGYNLDNNRGGSGYSTKDSYGYTYNEYMRDFAQIAASKTNDPAKKEAWNKIEDACKRNIDNSWIHWIKDRKAQKAFDGLSPDDILDVLRK